MRRRGGWGETFCLGAFGRLPTDTYGLRHSAGSGTRMSSRTPSRYTVLEQARGRAVSLARILRLKTSRGPRRPQGSTVGRPGRRACCRAECDGRAGSRAERMGCSLHDPGARCAVKRPSRQSGGSALIALTGVGPSIPELNNSIRIVRGCAKRSTRSTGRRPAMIDRCRVKSTRTFCLHLIVTSWSFCS